MPSVRGSIAVLAMGLGSGCFSARPSAPDSFLCQAARNTAEAPVRDIDEIEVIKFARKEAEKAWSAFCGNVKKHHSDPFHDGFVEGFVDYVLAGGTGEPPYLPPFRYRLVGSRTPEGVARVEDWYAGWRQGAAIAVSSGLRELTYVPLPAHAAVKDPNAIEPALAPPPALTDRSPWEEPALFPLPKTPPIAPPPTTPPPTIPPATIPPVQPLPMPPGPGPQPKGTPQAVAVPAPVASTQSAVLPTAAVSPPSTLRLNPKPDPNDPWRPAPVVFESGHN